MITGDILVLCILMTPAAAIAAATIVETININMFESELNRDNTEEKTIIHDKLEE